MVKYIVTGDVANNQKDSLIGYPSFYFDFLAQIESPTSTGFTITRGVLIPGLPDLPFEDDAPDEYFGSGLTYEDITINGYTMATPITGVITSVREIGPNFTTRGSDFVLQASDFFAVSLTPDDNDNKELLRDLFSGNDLLKGSSKGDKFDGFDGNDRVFGRGGDDELYGGKGNDKLFGGNGKDKLYGGNGNDRLYGENRNDKLFGEKGKDKLFGGNGNDKLFGGGGRDEINGGKGNDLLIGGAGTDTFIFSTRSAGQDTIRDFVVGVETIRIKAKDIDEFSDLSISYGGGDAVIAYGATQITVLNVANGGLDADDFLF